MHSQPIDFRHTEVAKHPERLSQIRYLLADSGLGLDNDITLFVEAWSGQLVGCAGLAANVIKCVAVNEQLRGENLSARLLAEVENARWSAAIFISSSAPGPATGALCPQRLLADCPERQQRGVDGEHAAGHRALLPFAARERKPGRILARL
jgi:hypothetical protein